MHLDRIDARILRALQENARLSFRQLARRVGVSVPTVSTRVNSLERLGIVAGYHAAIDPEKLHQTRLFLILRCRSPTADTVGRTLAKLPEVRWTIRTGSSRLIAEAVLRSAKSVQPFLRKLQSIEGVVSFEHYVAGKRFKESPRAILSGPLSTTVACFECGQAIDGEPIKLRLEGRTHYVCCPSCEQLYRERYARIRAAARAG
jgi:Lrp/AsnC family transcriptional regulator, leucine-responsive regulatory protein